MLCWCFLGSILYFRISHPSESDPLYCHKMRNNNLWGVVSTFKQCKCFFFDQCLYLHNNIIKQLWSIMEIMTCILFLVPCFSLWGISTLFPPAVAYSLWVSSPNDRWISRRPKGIYTSHVTRHSERVLLSSESNHLSLHINDCCGSTSAHVAFHASINKDLCTVCAPPYQPTVYRYHYTIEGAVTIH